MATITTGIYLQDNFTDVLYGVIEAVNLSLFSLEEMRQSMNGDISTAELDGARDRINQVTISVQQMVAAMKNAEGLHIQPDVIGEPITEPVSRAPVTEPAPLSLPQEAPVSEPIRIPVEWQVDDMPVFTETGIERYTQEIENANQMLSQLGDTQALIAQQASNMEFFSTDAQQDLSRMATRIDWIRNKLRSIEENPINVGSDEANAGIERLRQQLSLAVKEQQTLNYAVQNMDVERANEAYIRLSGTISNTERYIRDSVDAQGTFNQAIEQGQSSANELGQTIRRMVATYLSIQSLQKVIGLSDELASSKAKLDMMNDGVRTTQELQNMIYASAERSRGSYLGTMEAVAKLGNLAGEAFGSTEQVVAFSEQLNKHFALAGASTVEAKNATLQLTQALASGVLRGDELNSVAEQAPTVIQAIADYLNVPKGQIREMASEGEITADIVKNAMFAAAAETDAAFESMPKTFEQIGQSIQNTAVRAFEPVLTKLNELANSPEFDEFITGLCNGIAFFASVAVKAFDIVITAGAFIADNWSVIAPLITGAAIALGVYYGWQAAINALGKISYALHVLQAGAMMAHAAVTGTLTKATAQQIATQLGLNAALYACPIMWIIILIVALIAVIVSVIAAMHKFSDESVSAVEAVCGAFAVAGAFIGNLFISLINFIIEDFVTLWNFMALFANFFANFLTDPIGAVARLFFGFIDLALSGIQALASAIDMLFGTGFADSVAGWRSNLDSWVTEKYGEGKVVMEKKNAQDYYLEGFDYQAAWNKGTEFGSRFGNSGTDIAGLDPYSDFDYSSYLTDIEGNTEDIKEGLDISEEDLKYLRDIAEQEAINRFTTASITIEQTNHNQVSSSMDLDGVVTGLTDAVSEAAGMITEGVH